VNCPALPHQLAAISAAVGVDSTHKITLLAAFSSHILVYAAAADRSLAPAVCPPVRLAHGVGAGGSPLMETYRLVRRLHLHRAIFGLRRQYTMHDVCEAAARPRRACVWPLALTATVGRKELKQGDIYCHIGLSRLHNVVVRC
jgi:hypothetical protein